MTTVDLFKFTRGSSTWTLTWSDAVTYLSEVYAPAVIARGRIDQKTEVNKSNISIRVDVQTALAQVLLTTSDEEVMQVVLLESSESGTSAIWYGRMSAVTASGQMLDLTCESKFTALRQRGLRASYLKTCRHALYDPNCTVDRSLFEVSANAISWTAAGRTIVATGLSIYDDGYFTGGMLKDSTGVYRWITKHIAPDTLYLSQESPTVVSEVDLSGTSVIKVYPGCDLTRTTCVDKFNNVVNFGGFPWMPYKNPFDGSSIV